MSYGATRFAFGYQPTPWVVRLLVANTAVFLVTWVAGPQFFWEWFGFNPSHLFTRPWGMVTYMFLHGDVWHLLLNMLVLFFFGPPLEARWGSGEFLKYYFLCGLGGVALSFVFAAGVPIIGASAAIYGLMLAFAWYWPESPIYLWAIFPVKAKWLVGFFFVLTFLSAFGGAGGGVAHFAHLGGLVSGLVYLRFGSRIGAHLGDFRAATRAERFAIVPRSDVRTEEEGARSRPARPDRSRGDEEALLDEVDRILDKISATGIGSLTAAERRTLDDVSKQRRSN
jgi:membrane associated rhomboid family serine protease